MFLTECALISNKEDHARASHEQYALQLGLCALIVLRDLDVSALGTKRKLTKRAAQLNRRRLQRVMLPHCYFHLSLSRAKSRDQIRPAQFI